MCVGRKLDLLVCTNPCVVTCRLGQYSPIYNVYKATITIGITCLYSLLVSTPAEDQDTIIVYLYKGMA